MRIALAAEHFDAAPAVLIFSTSLNLCGCLCDRCLLSAVVVYDFTDRLPRDITILYSLHVASLLSLQISKKNPYGRHFSILHSTLYTAYIKNAHKAKANKGMMRNCTCLLYTSPSPRDRTRSRMPSSA